MTGISLNRISVYFDKKFLPTSVINYRYNQNGIMQQMSYNQSIKNTNILKYLLKLFSSSLNQIQI